jgi:hypothetical protein
MMKEDWDKKDDWALLQPIQKSADASDEDISGRHKESQTVVHQRLKWFASDHHYHRGES